MADNMSVVVSARSNTMRPKPSPVGQTSVSVLTPALILTRPSPVLVHVNHNEKPDKDPPTVREDEVDTQAFHAVDAWNHSAFLCRNYVLNDYIDGLYNVYSLKKTTEELWESLDQKYKSEDAGAKKFLMHKRKEMTVEQLVVRLRIKEDNRRFEKKFSNATASSAEANVVEHDGSKKKREPRSKLGPKGGIVKKKFQGKCFNCNKVGHKSADCKLPKQNKDKEANAVDTISKEVSDISLSTVVSKVNLVDSNPKEWCLDTGATRHIYCDWAKFVDLIPLETGEKLFMGNSATSVIKG
ncbi:uncharacterized protein LOC112092460 [Morus notabilis]|uniref:uncharacterized protein LOC112092460 n=1 Tax=Morus notabilis TaxID=981085 RepID=UPI000CECEEFE|nr:uncharacterized protein LOC112092460 [Morus notabilis]